MNSEHSLEDDLPPTSQQKLQTDQDGNFTPRSAKRLEQVWHKIADSDDSEVKAWQRIQRVNFFMLDQQVKQLIDRRLERVFQHLE